MRHTASKKENRWAIFVYSVVWEWPKNSFQNKCSKRGAVVIIPSVDTRQPCCLYCYRKVQKRKFCGRYTPRNNVAFTLFVHAKKSILTFMNGGEHLKKTLTLTCKGFLITPLAFCCWLSLLSIAVWTRVRSQHTHWSGGEATPTWQTWGRVHFWQYFFEPSFSFVKSFVQVRRRTFIVAILQVIFRYYYLIHFFSLLLHKVCWR